MDHARFAVCIIFPGTTSNDVVNAALRHGVHILDKEIYNAGKDYSTNKYEILNNGAIITSLFLFSDNDSILAENDDALDLALEKIRQIRN